MNYYLPPVKITPPRSIHRSVSNTTTDKSNILVVDSTLAYTDGVKEVVK